MTDDDLATASDEVLTDLAGRVFALGLLHGKMRSGPITREQLLVKLPDHPMRRIHAHKLRQVYGAGFDIAAANERIRIGEKT